MEIFLLLLLLVVAFVAHDLLYPSKRRLQAQPKPDPWYKTEPATQVDDEKHIFVQSPIPPAPPKLLTKKEPTTVIEPNKLVIEPEDDAFRK